MSAILAAGRIFADAACVQPLDAAEPVLLPIASEDHCMRLFVTGATGFIGAHFVELALSAGHQVVGMYRSRNPARGALLDHLRALGAELRRGDILDERALAAGAAGSDCICHFAAAFRESGVGDDYFRRINVTGTANVVNAAAAHDVERIVHCSTAGIHGQRVSGTIDESTPVRPWNIYEQTKVAAEEELRRRANAARIEHVILRPSAVYGPRDERLAKLFRAVAKGRFPLFGAGEGRRHMIYVTDLANAFLRACTASQAANRELIVAGPRAVPLRELLHLLAQAANRRSFGPKLPLNPMMVLTAVVEDVCKRLGIAPPLYRRRMDFYLNDAAFDCRLAERVLDWKATVDLPEGLARTLQDVGGPARPASVGASQAACRTNAQTPPCS